MLRPFNALILLYVVPFCYINAQRNQKVDVAVYYEALCSHSITFITKQLFPPLQNTKISKHVNLRLIPYGKTKTVSENNDFKFVCNHGQRECYVNKVHACALAKLPKLTDEQNIPLEFINCAMVADINNGGGSENSYPITDCASDEAANITQCAKTAEGSLLLNKYGLETDQLQKPLAYCPTIVFNGQFTVDESKRAERNFLQTVCAYIKPDDRPEDCKSIAAASFREKPLEMSVFVAIFGLLTIIYV